MHGKAVLKTIEPYAHTTHNRTRTRTRVAVA